MVAPDPASFTLDLPFGKLVAVGVGDPGEPEDPARLAELTAEERAHAETLRRFRRAEFIAGRTALRGAARAAGLDLGSVVPGEQGQPLLPEGLSGTIAHKRHIAVALVGPSQMGRLGVDVEEIHPPRDVIAQRVLVPEERQDVAALPGAERWESTLLRFAVKEAIYKAIWPEVRRYVAFSEARVRTAPLRVELRLARGEGPFELEALTLRRGEFLLAAVRLRAIDGPP